MATYPYMILADSEGDVTKRFKAIKMVLPKQRTDEFKVTAGGKIDKSAGVILNLFQYTLKVPAEASDPNYGTYEDLLSFFELNNPAPGIGQPSDRLTLTDHYGNSHYVKFREDLVPEPVTTQLEGPNAIYYIDVDFVKVGEVIGS
jgi:hypothetical protein